MCDELLLLLCLPVFLSTCMSVYVSSHFYIALDNLKSLPISHLFSPNVCLGNVYNNVGSMPLMLDNAAMLLLFVIYSLKKVSRSLSLISILPLVGCFEIIPKSLISCLSLLFPCASCLFLLLFASERIGGSPLERWGFLNMS